MCELLHSRNARQFKYADFHCLTYSPTDTRCSQIHSHHLHQHHQAIHRLYLSLLFFQPFSHSRCGWHPGNQCDRNRNSRVVAAGPILFLIHHLPRNPQLSLQELLAAQEAAKQALPQWATALIVIFAIIAVVALIVVGFFFKRARNALEVRAIATYESYRVVSFLTPPLSHPLFLFLRHDRRCKARLRLFWTTVTRSMRHNSLSSFRCGNVCSCSVSFFC